ncbi:hypothetical protein [Flavobacterium hydatis]|jgi:hypothetical protein|uniref:Uncharacterized protein n=1 Tax=Flavobacterium hydatis TaxID=991 RepID=A0A086AH87_FLAHY|nr:hypothetical protein [Flavobacterium hydatis]KFF16051.1 hypothetical protein IW20_11945 [Flavobacterium hydatis]OXA84501.1 hypothetical protein B0A62_25115 [Flavobacterium hydatis]
MENEIEKATISLLKMVNESCRNNISENLMFILSNENEVQADNFEIIRKERVKINLKKQPKNITEIFKELSDLYEKIYDLNLYVFKSEKNRTIIEIRYYLKTELETEFLKTVINNPAMLHCKIILPPYRKNDKEKFDINWHLGGIIHNWRSFWGKRRISKELKKMETLRNHK